MKRFDTKPYTALLRVIGNRSDPIDDHRPRCINVLVWCRSIDQHQKIRSYSRRLVDCTQIVVDPLPPIRSGSRWKHPSAAEARDLQSRIAQLPPHGCRIVAKGVAPGTDPLDPGSAARIDHLAQRGFACRHLVETQPVEISH